jgi:hypothetical protein
MERNRMRGSGMRHDVTELREVGAPRDAGDGAVWMTLGVAREHGVFLGDVAGDIGPRERGVVYLSGYWRTVNTVHEVFVKVRPRERNRETRRMLPLRAVWWTVSEQSAGDVRERRHCTSWTYAPNRPLFTIEGKREGPPWHLRTPAPGATYPPMGERQG